MLFIRGLVKLDGLFCSYKSRAMKLGIHFMIGITPFDTTIIHGRVAMDLPTSNYFSFFFILILSCTLETEV
jgi:hypothetical protein